jgi:hypothetical protein
MRKLKKKGGHDKCNTMVSFFMQQRRVHPKHNSEIEGRGTLSHLQELIPYPLVATEEKKPLGHAFSALTFHLDLCTSTLYGVHPFSTL